MKYKIDKATGLYIDYIPPTNLEPHEFREVALSDGGIDELADELVEWVYNMPYKRRLEFVTKAVDRIFTENDTELTFPFNASEEFTETGNIESVIRRWPSFFLKAAEKNHR
jgi:hypothetical protein